jgi:DNA-binding NarL/FixJ family response regulator
MTKREIIPVCVVEDDEFLRRLIVRWIEAEAGMKVIRAFPDAESALEIMENLSPKVALLDINLPGMNGIECVSRLKPLMPETQFAMVTVFDDDNMLFQALAAGATGYLLKQTSRAALIQAIWDLASGGSPMSMSIARRVVQTFHSERKEKHLREELSPRENEVLDGLVEGLLYKEIADMLGISMGTLHTHIRRIYEKLHVHSRAQAVFKVLGP